MHIHHLNCGTMCPWGGKLMDGVTDGYAKGKLVCHVLLIETDAHGLVLVDTGIGLHDCSNPGRLAGFFRNMMNLPLNPAETAVRQIQALGFSAADVRHILLTHLDFDHAGGLEDFPNATVHLMAAEEETARYREGFIARKRYRPSQWGDMSRWRSYRDGGEPWFGFEAVRDLAGLPPEILMIPLVGHTWGHAGIAIDTGAGWLLHAGDAYFFRGEMDPREPRCTPGLSMYQDLMEVDRKSRLRNQDRLRELGIAQAGKVRIFSAHDPVEFERAVAGPPVGQFSERRSGEDFGQDTGYAS